MATHVIKASTPPSDPPTDFGLHYIDEVGKVHYLSVGVDAVSDWIEVGRVDPVGAFLDLEDTPASYLNQQRKYLRVNDDENAVVFQDTLFTDSTDVPNSYGTAGGYKVVVKADETGLEFIPDPEGGSFTIPQNRIVYVDQATGDDTIIAKRGNIDAPFLTIGAANDFVTAQVPAKDNEWLIRVNPGQYLEDPMVLADYTVMQGQDKNSTVIFPTSDADPFFTIGTFNVLENLNIDGRVGGESGPISTNTGVEIGFANQTQINNCYIDNFNIGVNCSDAAGALLDIVCKDLNIGVFGSITTTCFSINAITGAYFSTLNLTGGATNGLNLAGNCVVTIEGGNIVSLGTAFNMIDCDLTVYDMRIAFVDSCAVGEEFVDLTMKSCFIRGNNNGDCFTAFGFFSAPFFTINDCKIIRFDTMFDLQDSTLCIVTSCLLQSGPDPDDRLAVLDFLSEMHLADCTCFGDPSILTTGIVTTSGSFPFVEIQDCFLFDYAIGVDLKSGNSTFRDNTFEILSGDPTGTIGILVEETALAKIRNTQFVVDIGCICQDDSAVVLEAVSFSGSTTEFEQKDNGLIVTNNSFFDEDFVKAVSWGNVQGQYLSTKVGDRGLVILDKLKVGVPERGDTTNLGQGAPFTRELLAYTFNSDTSEFVDVSQQAQSVGGTPIEFSSNNPNSAIYISHSLKTPEGDPIQFSGIWLNIIDFGDVGQGEIISEVWNGTSWQEIEDMFTQADAPYNQVPSGAGSNVPEGRYNFRFDDRADDIWEPSDPIGLGFESYWYRYRIKSDWFDTRWSNRIKVTTNPALIGGIVVNYPLFIDLANIDPTFWDNVQNGGEDIRMTNSTGSVELPVEIVGLNVPAKTGGLYFLADAITNAEPTDFYIYYGNEEATTPLPTAVNGAGQVWGAYLGVYHFQEEPVNGATILDSSVLTAIRNGTVEATNIVKGNDGVVGPYYTFDGTDDDSINLGNDPQFVSPQVPFAIEAVFRTTTGQNKRRIVSIANSATGNNQEDFFGMHIEGGNFVGLMNGNKGDTGINVEDGNWHHGVWLTENTGQFAGAYVDAQLAGIISGQGGSIDPSPFPARIGERGSLNGSFQFQGDIAEVRISNRLPSGAEVGTQVTNNFFNSVFWVFDIPEEFAQTQSVPSVNADPIVSSPKIDQIKILPQGFTEFSEDGFIQYFGAARSIRALQLSLNEFENTAGLLTPTTGPDIFLTKSHSQAGNFYFPENVRTQMTAVKILRTEVDISCPLRLRWHYTGFSNVAGNVLFRVSIAFSDNTTVFQASEATAPATVPKTSEGFVVGEIQVGRAGHDEFVGTEIVIPPIDTEQTFDARGDLMWITIERVGDSELDTYQTGIKIIEIQALAVIWREGSHTGIIGDAPPPGFP